MVKNYTIVIPFNLPWEWSTDYTNQTAFILSKENVVICYMWSESFSIKEYFKKRVFPKFVKKHSKNIYLFYPIYFIPFKRFPYIHNLNEKVNVFLLKLFVNWTSRKNNTNKKILWIFDPNNRFVIDLLGKGWKVIYDCVDYFMGAEAYKNSDDTKENEKALVKEADLVTAISKVLQKHLKKYRDDVYLVPQGFRIQDFQKKKYDAPRINMPHPIIGFAGAVNHRLDYKILLPLAKNNPQWSFVIWGPVLEEDKITESVKNMKAELLKLPNVSTGFLKDRKELPGVLKQFDVAMIPYDISQDFNKYCYPMKLFEFFYLGIPVVSTEVLELKRFPKLVKIGKNCQEWEKIIKGFLSKPWPRSNIKMEIKLARENSWENKVSKIVDHL
jgi:glycosyltransferase involved in cell wall biosynthesis